MFVTDLADKFQWKNSREKDGMKYRWPTDCKHSFNTGEHLRWIAGSSLKLQKVQFII